MLKTSKFLVAFLSETSQEAFNVKLLTIEEEVGPKNIFEFKTLTGEIETEARAKATKFCDSLDGFGKQYNNINTAICKYVKELQLKSHELADDYYAIGACVNSLQELTKLADIPQSVHFYKRISDLVIKTGDFVLETGELFNHNAGSWFKYQKQ